MAMLLARFALLVAFGMFASCLLNDDGDSLPSPLVTSDVKGKNLWFGKLYLSVPGRLTPYFPLEEQVAKTRLAWKLIFDAQGRPTNAKFYNAGKPGSDENLGYGEIRIVYAAGSAEWSFYDHVGHGTADPTGVFAKRFTTDATKKMMTVLNLNRTRDITNNAVGIAKIVWKLNEAGLPERGTFYNRNNQRTADAFGFTEAHLNYDKADRLTSIANHGVKGGDVLVASIFGVAFISFAFDASYNVVEETYYNAAAEIVGRKDSGIAKTLREFDERGSLIDETYFDAQDQPAAKKSGPHRAQFTYDSASRLTSTKYFDVKGKPVLDAGQKAASIARVFDASGDLVEISFSGTDGKATANPDGVASVKMTYDKSGNKLSERYFDALKQGVLHKKAGSGGFSYLYDASGRTIRQRSLGVDGKPANNPLTGVVDIRRSYDGSSDRVLEESYADQDGAQVLHSISGVAAITWTYDEKGQIKVIGYRGLLGVPILNRHFNAFNIALEYSGEGNLSAVNYLGTEREPIASTNHGAATVKIAYDDDNFIKSVTYLDPQGKEIDVSADTSVPATAE